MRKFDPKHARKIIVKFIQDYLKNAGFTKLVIGLSGGLDSACCAYLASEAIGKENIFLLNLPYKLSSPHSLNDAKLVAESLGIELDVFEITKPVDAILEAGHEPDKLRLGNICARMRMICLYDYASEKNALVVATGNKSEAYLGYTTLWGDMAGAFAPLGDIFKTDERDLAADLGVPQKIIDKAPTADLWQNQTDESEMGITYADADMTFSMLFEEHLTRDDLVNKGVSRSRIEHALNLYRKNEFKRRMPIFPNIT